MQTSLLLWLLQLYYNCKPLARFCSQMYCCRSTAIERRNETAALATSGWRRIARFDGASNSPGLHFEEFALAQCQTNDSHEAATPAMLAGDQPESESILRIDFDGNP